MRVKINLDTMKSVKAFVDIATQMISGVYLTNDDHKYVVSAKSMLGVMHSLEWADGLWLECEDENAYSKFKQFMEV